MASKEYIEHLKLTVERLHNCSARWHHSGHVHEVFQGKTAWDVEVFVLDGHPKASICYGWFYGDPEEFITILELLPVDSPESAVKMGMARQTKKREL